MRFASIFVTVINKQAYVAYFMPSTHCSRLMGSLGEIYYIIFLQHF